MIRRAWMVVALGVSSVACAGPQTSGRGGDAAALQSPALRAKLQNPDVLAHKLATSPAGADVFVQLKAAAAARGERAVRALLSGAGLQVATVAKDIVTGKLQQGRLEALLKLPEVLSVRASGRVQLR